MLRKEKYEEICATFEQAMDVLRLKAAKSCLDLWYDFDEAETKGMPVAVVSAWQVGRDLSALLAVSNHFYSTVSPPKEDEHLSPNDK
jgi:hypothetical protein